MLAILILLTLLLSSPLPSLTQLLTTIPLDITLKWIDQPALANRLTYSSSHIIGLGLRGENPHDTYVLTEHSLFVNLFLFLLFFFNIFKEAARKYFSSILFPFLCFFLCFVFSLSCG